jgi:hypothetical protein
VHGGGVGEGVSVSDRMNQASVWLSCKLLT